MANYTKTNLREVENQAPNFGMPEELEARFARRDIEGQTLGLSLMSLQPGLRIPFGRKHTGQEEVYVVVRGSGRIKVDDDVVELAQWDAIRFGKHTMRNVEAGPDGIEYIAFGAGEDPRDAEMVQGWWGTNHTVLAHRGGTHGRIEEARSSRHRDHRRGCHRLRLCSRACTVRSARSSPRCAWNRRGCERQERRVRHPPFDVGREPQASR